MTAGVKRAICTLAERTGRNAAASRRLRSLVVLLQERSRSKNACAILQMARTRDGFLLATRREMVEFRLRKKRWLHLPITLSVVLVSLDVLLMVFWIILLARQQLWGGLAIGTVGFSVILCGIAAYMVIAVKEIRLNQRQANFVDSVTHELKSPIATLRLYLETLQMREMEGCSGRSFTSMMEAELNRLSSLINQLLEVGRLDAIGQR